MSCPSLGFSTLVSILIVVVLPAPLGPRKPKMTPASTANEMWSTAVNQSKRLTRLQTLMIAAVILPTIPLGQACMVILSQPCAQVVICQIVHYELTLKRHFRY